jgi:hypothetical protein
VTQPKNVIFAVALMLLGVPAYFIWRSRSSKSTVGVRPAANET